jgi:acetyl-CoA carboxylase biotin carboxyl carrier protein
MAHGVKQVMSDQDTQASQAEPSVEVTSTERGRRNRGRRRDENLPKHLEASINMDELQQLVSLIIENGVMDFELEREGFRVKVGRNVYPQSVAESAPMAPTGTDKQVASAAIHSGAAVQSLPTSAPPHPGAQAEEAASEDQGLHLITSPIVGTFYRAPSPTTESFVRIGSQVEPETVVCIIEAMKLMNEIQAETTGEVVKIYVENGQAVEYGQPLFGIKQ